MVFLKAIYTIVQLHHTPSCDESMKLDVHICSCEWQNKHTMSAVKRDQIVQDYIDQLWLYGRYLNVTLILRDASSQLLASGALASVQFEFLASQNFTFLNPSASPEVKATGTVLATADFVGNGGFSVGIQGSGACRRFLDEDIQASNHLSGCYSTNILCIHLFFPHRRLIVPYLLSL